MQPEPLFCLLARGLTRDRRRRKNLDLVVIVVVILGFIPCLRFGRSNVLALVSVVFVLPVFTSVHTASPSGLLGGRLIGGLGPEFRIVVRPVFCGLFEVFKILQRVGRVDLFIRAGMIDVFGVSRQLVGFISSSASADLREG